MTPTTQTRLTETLPPNVRFSEVRMYRMTTPPHSLRAIVLVDTPDAGVLCACALDLDAAALTVSTGGVG